MLLPAGQGHAALAHQSVVAAWKGADLLVDGHESGQSLHLGAREVVASEGYIPRNREREEKRLLRDVSEEAAQFAELQIADVDAAHEDRPRRRIVETHEQFHESRLAGAGAAGDTEGAAGGEAEGDPVEHFKVAAGVGEVKIAHLDGRRR